MIEIEREAEIFLREHDGPLWPQRVTNAELIHCVDVRGGQIRNDQIRRKQIVVHRLVDDGGMDDLVGANAGMAGLFHDRFDDVFVGSVQVQDTLRVRLEVGLFAEAHNDETATHNSLRLAGEAAAAGVVAINGCF